jgi:hypothetical protein
MRWKSATNAFAITFGDRFPAAETRQRTGGNTNFVDWLDGDRVFSP